MTSSNGCIVIAHQTLKRGIVTAYSGSLHGSEGPVVQKNSTPALTSFQAQKLLDAIPRETLNGKRGLALLWTYLITACRGSAMIRTRVGDLNFYGVD